MLSDSIIYVMVVTMKLIKVSTQKTIETGAIDDSISINVPTVMIVQELASNLYLDEHFKTIVFGMHNKNNHNFDRTKLNMLAKTIANRTLWDISQDNIFIKEYNEDYYDTNIMTELAGYNYEAKYKIWLNKLRKLIFESIEHWIINQFQYFKIFLFNNLFEPDLSEIPKYSIKVVLHLNELKSKDSSQTKTNTSKQQDKKNEGNEWNNTIKNTADEEPDIVQT